MSAVPERNLERYDLIERIAVGGMAEVFLAKAYGAHGFEKTLAIKRILPELAADPEFEERFIAEAKLAVRLTHANIVQVFDFGRGAGSLFIAMEHVDGVDLAALLARHRERGERVPLPAAFHIAIELARGLDFAHGRGIIHRDVSPSNILLSRAGEVKIADFGIALPASQDSGVTPHRRRIMGKWRYMSPEQTRGETLDTSSDLFAAAAVMYELFVGEKLFPGEEPEAIIENIHHMDIPRASAQRAGLPPRLDEVLAAALQRDPDRRPARAADVQRALTEISYESSIVATALEVAEAVLRVTVQAAAEDRRPPRPVSIDDLIRQQLGAVAPATERRTLAGDDPPGAAEQVEHAGHAEPAGRATEPRGEGTEPAELTGEQTVTLVRAGMDSDGLTVWSMKQPDPARPRGPRRRLAALALASALLLLGAIVWSVAREPGRVATLGMHVPDAAVADAVPVDARATGLLIITSTPEGADVWLDGEQAAGVTPLSQFVSAAEPVRVEVRLDGYLPVLREAVQVSAADTVTVHAQLARARASLTVHTVPSGARVRLDGQLLGSTPLAVGDLPPGSGSLVIARAGYRPVNVSINLVAGETVEITRQLSQVRHGTIDLHIDDGWADIYLDDRKIGRAPVRGLKLTEGRHRLRLHNPVSNKQTFLSVDVVADETRYYRTTL